MPFERYLQPDPEPGPQSDPSAGSSSNAAHDFGQPPFDGIPRGPMYGVDASTFSGGVQFQMPHFMQAGLPTVAPGGGAEVLPMGFTGMQGTMGSSWFANSGFTPRASEEVYTPPPPKYPLSSYSTLSAHLSAEDRGNASPASIGSSVFLSHLPPSRPPILAPTPSQCHPMPSLTAASHPGPRAFGSLAASLSAPSPLGLPVYSSSGFDLLSILARVAHRQNPKIVLGPVDMSCSFVVVDTRRFDNPMVYASPSFCRLTGYEEHEVLGRNCRFLQSPDGQVQRGEPRSYTSPEAVAYLRKSLVSDKECQTSIINYKKDGSAFINLITIIPVAGGVSNSPDEADDIVYHVGFQVDLTEQPNAILQKLRDGSYMVNYSSSYVGSVATSMFPSRDRRNKSYSLNAVSKDLRYLLEDQDFVSSLSPSAAAPTDDAADWNEGNQPLSLLLLDAAPDFLLVLSLKGSFLYVSPSVRRVLGYDPEELAGKSVVDYCHTSDLVPLMRELKESSTPSTAPQDPYGLGALAAFPGAPKTVNLLFRARCASGEYIWLDCRGRLHVEPGKGRKAIILSARATSVPSLDWGSVVSANQPPPALDIPPARGADPEIWAMLSAGGTVLFMGAGAKDLTGWGVAEVIGMALGDFVLDGANGPCAAALRRVVARESVAPEHVRCKVRKKAGGTLELELVLYPLPAPAKTEPCAPPLPVVCQFRLPGAARPFVSVPPAEENLLLELETARTTSWQYELQQLKIENQRLCAEIEGLEAGLRPPEQQRAVPRALPDDAYPQDVRYHASTAEWVSG